MLKKIKKAARQFASSIFNRFRSHAPRCPSCVRLEVGELEDRFTPATLSFLLDNGVAGFGQFTPPDLTGSTNPVDPMESYQSLEVNDLVLHLGGEAFSGSDFVSTPTAEYSYGEFLGLNFEIEGPIDYDYFLIEVQQTQVTAWAFDPNAPFISNLACDYFSDVDSKINQIWILPERELAEPDPSIPMIYDPGDDYTPFTFQLKEDVFWSDRPWLLELDHFDLPFDNGEFMLNFAGHLFHPGDGYTTASAQYSYGQFVGLTFNIAGYLVNDFPYLSISFSGTELVAVNQDNEEISGTLLDPQQVTVEALNDATEGGSNGVLQFTRTGDVTQALIVQYTIGGTATAGTDYTPLSGWVTFTAGSSTATVEVETIDDNFNDPDETVIVTVVDWLGYTAGTQDEAELFILDDEI